MNIVLVVNDSFCYAYGYFIVGSINMNYYTTILYYYILYIIILFYL